METVKIDMNRLKNYLSDLDPDTSIVDEAIATIEAVAENKTDDELYERERPLIIAYLALRIVKAGLNVSPQNDEVYGHWIQANDIDETAWRCSKCDLTWLLDEGTPSQNEMRYCPKCGAKMYEEESGNA